MKKKYKKISVILLCVLFVCSMWGCRQEENEKETGTQETGNTSGHASVSTVALTEGKFSEEKLDDTWDEDTAVSFSLENDKISVKENRLGDKAEISGSTITIRQEGVYLFSGTLADGQIIVDADKKETVRLVFQGVTLTCSDSAPLYSKGGDVIVTLADGTENRIEDGSTYTFEQEGEDEPNGAIFAKDDLTFNGNGTLYVTGNYNHGIQCKDALKFVAGTYIISAANDGIVGKDSVSVRNGNFTIESGDDGIKATNAEDSEKGYILIENGVFQIHSKGDGLQAETLLRVNDGEFKITSGEGSQNAVSEVQNELGEKRMPFDGGQGRPDRGTDEEAMTPPDGMTPQGGLPPEGEMQKEMAPPDGERPEEMSPSGGETPKKDMQNHISEDSESTAESPSTKGLKSYVELLIAGGEFDIDAQDDGFHSNQNVTIQGGTIKISTGDDGIHAEKTLRVDDGSIDIEKSYEGLEGFDVIINEGDIKIISSDDGINAAGDNADNNSNDNENTEGKSQHFMAEEDQGAAMTINGGEIYVNANGDGLDANGDIFINGGAVTVHGPVNGGNGTLDYAASCKITGGTFIGIGSIGMAQAPSKDSTQPSLIFQTEGIIEAGTALSLKDKDGNILAETVTEKNAQWIAVSSPELTVEENYIFCAGTTEKEVIPTETITQFSL